LNEADALSGFATKILVLLKVPALAPALNINTLPTEALAPGSATITSPGKIPKLIVVALVNVAKLLEIATEPLVIVIEPVADTGATLTE
jgi:hypothetical protein